MRSFIVKKDMPHCLFVGKSGTGKTAMAYALRYELGLFTQDQFKEINASDERKIEVIRDVVKSFAKTSTVSDKVDFKLFLIDEIDGMLKLSQQALRRIMELHKGVRFIITSNEVSAVSQALVSRCAVFQFRALTVQQMAVVINRVLAKENKSLPTDVIGQICVLAEGDARLAINSLEAMLSLENPTAQDVNQFIGKAVEENVYHLMGKAKLGDYEAFTVAKTMITNGENPSAIMRHVYNAMLSPKVWGYSDYERARILVLLGTLPGSTDEMRLMAFLARVITDRKLR